MYIAIKTTILSINIHIYRWVNHGVVERGVKHGHLV